MPDSLDYPPYLLACLSLDLPCFSESLLSEDSCPSQNLSFLSHCALFVSRSPFSLFRSTSRELLLDLFECQLQDRMAVHLLWFVRQFICLLRCTLLLTLPQSCSPITMGNVSTLGPVCIAWSFDCLSALNSVLTPSFGGPAAAGSVALSAALFAHLWPCPLGFLSLQV